MARGPSSSTGRAIGSCRASTRWPTWRPATWSRRRSPGGCSRPATRTCGWTPASSTHRFWETRFPTILATCRRYGVDPVTELIPVAPACHYASGGVATDLWGRSSLPGSLRHGRGRLLRRARRQPPGLQLPPRGPRVLAPDRRGAARRAAAVERPGAGPRARRCSRRRRLAAPAGGDDVTGRGPAIGRRAARRTRAPGRARRRRPPAESTRTPGRRPTCSRSRRSWPRPRCAARRPAARTGARTSPTGTTSPVRPPRLVGRATAAPEGGVPAGARRPTWSPTRCRHEHVVRRAARRCSTAGRGGPRPATRSWLPSTPPSRRTCRAVRST